jgi:hypothetical protein
VVWEEPYGWFTAIVSALVTQDANTVLSLSAAVDGLVDTVTEQMTKAKLGGRREVVVVKGVNREGSLIRWELIITGELCIEQCRLLSAGIT